MIEELFSLAGRVALVTGSTQGLGLGMARALAAAGARIGINGRNAEKVDAISARLKGEGLNAFGCAFDLTDPAAMEAGIAAIERDQGPIDILVNNAAVLNRGPLAHYSRESWRGVMATDLEGPVFLSQRVVRGMRERRRGKIISIASLAAVTGRYDIAAYSTAKAGLVALTRQMALEWGRDNVQVNAIAPGWFRTEMVDETLAINPAIGEWVEQRTPAGRWGDPAKDLNGTIIFLASGASDYVNGHTLFVDGGHLTANGL